MSVPSRLKLSRRERSVYSKVSEVQMDPGSLPYKNWKGSQWSTREPKCGLGGPCKTHQDSSGSWSPRAPYSHRQRSSIFPPYPYQPSSQASFCPDSPPNLPTRSSSHQGHSQSGDKHVHPIRRDPPSFHSRNTLSRPCELPESDSQELNPVEKSWVWASGRRGCLKWAANEGGIGSPGCFWDSS